MAIHVEKRCLRYLSEMAREGRDLDEWVTSFDPVYFPGVTRPQLRRVLEKMRASDMVPAARPPAGPEGLFGGRQ